MVHRPCGTRWGLTLAKSALLGPWLDLNHARTQQQQQQQQHELITTNND
ncbi:hypothetical protein GLYMA_12G176450v4 [Glycine max]|nr:hypothetical protein GLYMA_12G176450v4 [Glycine max]KAH1143680.1 hypothetical protein GYH30_034086 [Glycine max]